MSDRDDEQARYDREFAIVMWPIVREWLHKVHRVLKPYLDELEADDKEGRL